MDASQVIAGSSNNVAGGVVLSARRAANSVLETWEAWEPRVGAHQIPVRAAASPARGQRSWDVRQNPPITESPVSPAR